MSGSLSQYHRTAHWLGLAMAVPLLVLAGWEAFEGWHPIDLDDRNEHYGVALFAPAAAVAIYILARAAGWFLVELWD